MARAGRAREGQDRLRPALERQGHAVAAPTGHRRALPDWRRCRRYEKTAAAGPIENPVGLIYATARRVEWDELRGERAEERRREALAHASNGEPMASSPEDLREWRDEIAALNDLDALSPSSRRDRRLVGGSEGEPGAGDGVTFFAPPASMNLCRTSHARKSLILCSGMKHLVAALPLLVLVLGLGCETDSAPSPADISRDAGRTTSQPVLVRSLAGRPPWAFPSAYSEGEIVEEMRVHAADVAAQEPDTPVLAYVLLSDRIAVTDFLEIVRTYNLFVDEKAVAFVRLGDLAILSLDLTSQSLEDETSFARAVAAAANEYGISVPEAHPPLKIELFNIWGSGADLERLWHDHRDLIRAVGIGGRKGQVPGLWYPIRPGEPLR